MDATENKATDGQSRKRRHALADLLSPTALPQNGPQHNRKVAIGDLWFGLNEDIVKGALQRSDQPSVQPPSHPEVKPERRRRPGLADLFEYPGANFEEFDRPSALTACDRCGA